eukprot:GCRY01001380.1.p1 GENE.GCRY01001380.1~~GCRY01001380.1.p1  ORF type:complete len:171 (+),score=40.58 GCRY01001380.1:162-674(+)
MPKRKRESEKDGGGEDEQIEHIEQTELLPLDPEMFELLASFETDALEKDEKSKDKSAAEEEKELEEIDVPSEPHRKRLFTKELAYMMYGFGDSKAPYAETVAVLEDIVQDYIADMTRRAVSFSRRRGRLQTEDFVFVIRKDKKKYRRVRELLFMLEEIQQVRKNCETSGE